MPQWLRTCLAVAALASLASLTACSNSPTTPGGAGASSGATLSLTASPSPITAVHCDPQCTGSSGTGFPFSATMTITLQEGAGIGGNITSMVLNASTSGGSFPALTFTSDMVTQMAGTNHIAARGNLAVPVTIVYSTPNGTANLTINISVAFTDDKGNQVTATGTVSVV